MDLVSTLLENNINQAIMLNKILVKNETQINSIGKEQKELENKNSMITHVLNSWSNLWKRVWTRSSSPNIQNIQENVNNKNNLLDISNQEIINNSNNNYDKGNDENNLEQNLTLLSELANSLSQNLDLQNEMLDTINEKNISLEENLQKNQTKIDYLIQKC